MSVCTRVLALVACAIVSGCVTPTAVDEATTARIESPTATSAAPTRDSLEHYHLERARAHEVDRNWADALVRWELLTLLRPDKAEYGDAVVTTRNRIRAATAGLTKAAAQARQQGNLDQAMQLYLRILNLNREDIAAAQALRDIDAERTQRAYLNRPPRSFYNK